jgi:hypothetical protein
VPRGSTIRCHPAGLLGIWGLVVGAGMLVLGAQASRPGDSGAAPARWPSGSRIPLDDRVPTLLIFLHPRCPCSRASLAELASLSSRSGDRVSVRAVLLRPERAGGSEDWSEIEADLSDWPRLTIWLDPGGEEARRFGVATSGHVLLYDPGGRRLFSGGITPARGHRGDNRGRDTVLERILGMAGDPTESPVFGCPLATPRRDPSRRSP